ncbi:hypothetical protein HLB44_02055 [Aquincola sp. S2]|uniref:Lipoprotein n=1 Tax=Pseudaquabacterium terrae TaxID=2732868 RepID=A0ABX2EB17_9BURK|nr:DUF6174 domain-containing protein [Aquabacterium terrae]NRF65761.1 hypothetical protein [Aquabacterium terrae]
MKRLMALLVAAWLPLTGCGGDSDPDRDPTVTAAKQRWLDANVRSYRFTYSMSCFCPSRGPIAVTVRDNLVIEAHAKETGMALPAEELKSVQTIGRIFDRIDDAYAHKASVIRVTADQTYGYPTSVYIDYSGGFVDDEVGFTIVEFVAGA